MDKIKILIADDQTLFREGMASILKGFKGFSVVGEAVNGKDLLEKIPLFKPHIVLLDLKMPVMDGNLALTLIKEKFPALKVIILTMYEEENFIRDLIENGACGYLQKDSHIDEVEITIRKVFENGYYFSDHIENMMRKNMLLKKVSNKHVNTGFSDQELEVLKLICKEFSNSEIGEILKVSPRTVEGYKARMQQKAGVKSIPGLIVYALKNDII
jgi:DNA-binding NarL/FixJ family response regulator